MSETPRRFQIHLSTAVVMMIAAGFLIWANVTGETRVVRYEGVGFPQPFAVTSKELGFPYRCRAYVVITQGAPRSFAENEVDRTKVLMVITVFINVIIAILLLSTIWFVCEWWIRWRAEQKGT